LRYINYTDNLYQIDRKIERSTIMKRVGS